MNPSSPMVAEMVQAVRADIRQVAERLKVEPSQELYSMVAHHFGWEHSEPSGKAVRPLLCLLCCHASGGEWIRAVPAASAIELIHNFSLIHDDIQDRSELRRHRPSVWTKWGEAQAINAGDALFGLAHLSLQRLDEPPQLVLQLNELIDESCLELTRGQYLDLSFDVSEPGALERYIRMIEAKTASLLAASTTAGAVLGGLSGSELAPYRDYGHHLGVAFQIQDDTLGIWGSPERTGKSAVDDLEARKPSYAALYALHAAPAFADMWNDPQADVLELRQAMEEAGSLEAAHAAAAKHTAAAVEALERTGVAPTELLDLTVDLLERQT